jgi:hypothetical protein
MQTKQGLSVRFGMVFALALLLCAPMAMAQAGRITYQGHVTSMVADGSGYRVTLDNGGYSYWVPSATVSDRNIRVGDYVRFDGYGNNGLVTVDSAAWLGGRDYNPDYNNNQPMYSAAPVGMMTAVVQNVNRHYNYITVRDQVTNRLVKIDVRRMDTRDSVNVWRLRPGDRINVAGGWENHNTFQADRVYF